MGVPRPEGQPPLGVGEVDGPYHLALRRALTPFFSSGAVEKMRPFMEQSVHWFLDQRIADGRMDLVLDYASPVPAILTMRLMGLPYDNWQLYAEPLPFGDGRFRRRRVQQGDRRSPRDDRRPAEVRGDPTGRPSGRPDELPGPVRIRRQATGRQPAHRHSLEPHRRRRRHHDVTDRAEPAAPRHPPGSAATAHRSSRALPHRGATSFCGIARSTRR